MAKGAISDFLVGQDMYGQAIGVHYKGSDTYQTRLGALCTIITYVLMAFNLATLIQAYSDGSNQEEKTQLTKTDSFLTDPYNLNDQNFNISILSYPPTPESIGQFVMYHNANDKYRRIEQKLCKDDPERSKRLEDYWVPRIGESNFSPMLPSAKCIYDEDIYIQATPVSEEYSLAYIEFIPCSVYSDKI